MNNDEIRNELIKRYKYIYENAKIFLAPFIIEEINKYSQKKEKISYFDIIPAYVLNSLEFFLLSDLKMEDSHFYNDIENKKENSEYLLKVKEKIKLLDKKNVEKELSSFKVFQVIRKYIDDQVSDIDNKEKKLLVLDEYFRIDRYTNDSKIWTSGVLLDIQDIRNGIEIKSGVILKNMHLYNRNRLDYGVTNNSFIETVSNKDNYGTNKSFLQEIEKEKIYFTYHDEIPWHRKIYCDDTDMNLETLSLLRPSNTSPCGEMFYLKEEDIFIYDKNLINRFYTICPHCGYIVRVTNNMLSEGIIKRIESRCMKDKDLFHKKYLYSELFSLDKKNDFKILKKKIYN